jgi:Domain of unknown function (DUF4286)
MMIYEVNVFVNLEVETAYRAWLQSHIEEILRLPGFISAQYFDVQDAEATARQEAAICVQYCVTSQSDLDRYLAQDAPRLRSDGLKRFPNQFRATRRVMTFIKAFEAPSY